MGIIQKKELARLLEKVFSFSEHTIFQVNNYRVSSKLSDRMTHVNLLCSLRDGHAYILHSTCVCRSVMSYNRFMLINHFFHLNNNETAVGRGHQGFDPWHKIKPLLDHLNERFKKYFVPEKYLSIHESMVGMKNRHI